MNMSEAGKLYKVSRQAIAQRMQRAGVNTAEYITSAGEFTESGMAWLQLHYGTKYEQEKAVESSIAKQVINLRAEKDDCLKRIDQLTEELQAMTERAEKAEAEAREMKMQRDIIEAHREADAAIIAELRSQVAELKQDKATLNAHLEESIKRVSIPRLYGETDEAAAAGDPAQEKTEAPTDQKKRRRGWWSRH